MAAWSRGDAAALSVAGSAWRHLPSFCVAGVALSNNYRRFAWQASHLWHWAGSGGALGAPWSRSDAAALCVAGGAWRHLPSFCVAGVALGNIYRRFAWQVALMALGWLWWHTWALWSRGDAAALCVAGVALGNIYRPFCAAGILFASSS